MKIECLASSSAANSYVIQAKDTVILMEAGLDYATTKSRLAALNLWTKDIKAVVITHKHGDHANKATVQQLEKYGPIICNLDTIEATETKNGFPVVEWKTYQIGKLRITPFNVDHDVPAFGYIIEDTDTRESMIFINDTAYVRYNFSKYNFTYVMIECNHMLEIVNMDEVQSRRKIKSHLSLEATIKALENMNLKKTKAIYLMHLSDNNSDERYMIAAVESKFGVPTYACRKHGGFSSGNR